MSITITPVHPDDLVELRLVIKAALAPGAQDILQRYLASTELTGQADYVPPFGSSDGPKDAWDLPPWADTPEDRAAMTWLVNDLTEQQLDVLLGVINEPGSTTGSLVRGAGYPEDTAASPVFRAIGSRFRRVGRRPLWVGGDKTPDGQALGATTNQVAVRLFREALTKRAERTVGVLDDPGTWQLVVEHAHLTKADLALIEAFRGFDGHRATATMLADRLGFKGFGGANLAIGRLGVRLADSFAAVVPGYVPSTRPDGSPMWWHVVATGEEIDGAFWWTLRPGLNQAAS
jgi:hypothetical protein